MKTVLFPRPSAAESGRERPCGAVPSWPAAVLILVPLLGRWAFLAAGTLELSEDEAYQWIWSKHLDLSYFSKPPLIAYVQRLGTLLWGDTAFGVRFFSPLLAALASFAVYRLLLREAGARPAWMFLAALCAMPLPAAGAVLMTVDPLLVAFGCFAMVFGWRAVQNDRLADWMLCGLCMGLAFLSKYTGAFLLVSWICFFVCAPRYRPLLRGPGPWVALALLIAATIPVLVWNAQHDWVTARHLASDGKLGEPWQPTLRHLADFFGKSAVLLNPVFFAGMLWALLRFPRRFPAEPFPRFLACMGLPVFLFYLAFSLHARVLENWIAASVVPLLALAAVFWGSAPMAAGIRRLWACGWFAGLLVVVGLHDTGWMTWIRGEPLPPRMDPNARVRGYREMARVVEAARARLAAEGPAAFIIANHYGLVSQITFYEPAAKEAVTRQPRVYFPRTARPVNQFYFWPDYRERVGQSALYVDEVRPGRPLPPLPANMVREFESVEDWGVVPVIDRGREIRRVRLIACRQLKPPGG